MTTMAGAVPVSDRARRGLLGCGALGTLAFLYAVYSGEATRAWQALLVNVLFFTGLAHAGVVVSALMRVTSARWGGALKRLAEATSAFLPLGCGLLLVLFLGISAWAPWVKAPVAAKTPWLNVPFFVARHALAFMGLTGLSVAYVYRSLRPDIGMLDESGQLRASGAARRLIGGWRGVVAERQRNQRAQDILAPCLLIAYAWVFSLVGFDFVMALDPHWFSTLAGAYYFMGNLLIGIAFLTGAAVWSRDRLQLRHYIGDQQLHDIGKLLFGFSVLWAYMVWSQYLVIWYGDLPEETVFVANRMDQPWTVLTWTVVGLVFAVPFVVLLSRRIKSHAGGIAAVAGVVLLGMWLERFLLVAPSIWHGETLPLGIVELSVTLGVAALFAWCYTTFLSIFPALPISDPRLIATAEH